MPSAADSILPRHGEWLSPFGEEWRWALAAAVLLHLLLALALALAPDEPALVPTEESGIAVKIVAPPAPPDAAPSLPPPVLSTPPVPQPQAPAAPPAMVAPTKMLSRKALADPRSRQARTSLATLDGSERMVQLCNLEALEQIHAWNAGFDPELVVPYAMRNETVSATTVTAGGAAFRSHDAWYGLSFECRLGGGGRQVVAFRFRVGDAIPPARWADLGLPSGPGLD